MAARVFAAATLLAVLGGTAGCTCRTGMLGGADSGGGPAADGGGGGGTDAASGDVRDDPVAMCARWSGDRATLTEGTWSGDLATCTPGDISADGRDSALRLVNLYRWLARLPGVDHEASRDSDAQACALLMNANGMLSHTPPPTWTCYTTAGANGAGSSNIAAYPGVLAVDVYMADYGNDTTIGHRRWILANSTGPVGLGSTSSFSCLQVIGGTGNAGAAWTAWPPPGPIPLEAASMLDTTGWTIQSDTIDLSAAAATVTAGGAPRAVTVVQLLGGYGSASAINLLPSGWIAQAGMTYHVEVTGVAAPISYDVDVVDCP
ncbi:MAG TPA: hypothetical protein VG389_04455 [Myxococcota bacterium]|nr:hypothetical protein [Myxococcota bacterium]